MITVSRITTTVAATALLAGGGAAVAVAADPGTCDGSRQQARQGTGVQQRQGALKQRRAGAGSRAGARMQRPGTARRRGAPSRRGGPGRIVLPARTNPAPLSNTEQAALTYMREEEKLARDVYLAMNARWGDRTFANIAASESRHMAAVKALLVRYGVADPAAGAARGEFRDAKLRALYEELVAKGRTSLRAALEVGATIERTDIADLDERAATLEHDDLATVFARLKRGSQNHLRAFTARLAAIG